MSTASATPQQMRDRLLQAIDSQSNICNMVAVLDVISNLEKYPITKEALEETRLGKLINDVRKKTKDEDLAKRAKKLLRNWQKLIEPCQSDVPPRGAQVGPGSANGGSHACRPDTPSTTAPPPSKIAPELKTRNDIHNTYSPVAEKSTSRKRKGDQRDGSHLPSKMQKTLPFGQVYSSTPPSNGIGASTESLQEKQDDVGLDRNRPDHLENDRQSKIPVNAVKPHPSSPGHTKLPSTSSLLKASVLQQQTRTEGDGGEKHSPVVPQYSSLTSHNVARETTTKRTSTYAPKGTLQSPAHISSQVPSVLTVSSPARVSRVDSPSLHEPQDRSAGQASQSLRGSPEQEPPELHRHNFSTDLAKGSPDSLTSNKKRKKYRSRDYTVNLQGQAPEDRTKPVRLKERRLTFDPVTGQIKPLTPKESHQEEESPAPPFMEPTRTDGPQQSSNPFQQANWKELSRNEIIQSYLNLQSNVLTSSGAQTHGAHFFMTEYLKKEEHGVRDVTKMHVIAPSASNTEMPGVTRDVTAEDLDRIHAQHWPGVNGCYDTKDNWYDWTECISLDVHGDETRLNILPYVCLD